MYLVMIFLSFIGTSAIFYGAKHKPQSITCILLNRLAVRIRIRSLVSFGFGAEEVASERNVSVYLDSSAVLDPLWDFFFIQDVLGLLFTFESDHQRHLHRK